jgi:hypothetical protein
LESFYEGDITDEENIDRPLDNTAIPLSQKEKAAIKKGHTPDEINSIRRTLKTQRNRFIAEFTTE